MSPFFLVHAFIDTIRYLWLHLLLCFALPVLLTFTSYAKHAPSIGKGTVVAWIADKYLSILAFSFLGLLTGYFLSRGIDPQTKMNSFATGLGVGIVPAIAAGIAYFEADPAPVAGATATSAAPVKPRSGIVGFLIMTLITYQMFAFQTTAIYMS